MRHQASFQTGFGKVNFDAFWDPNGLIKGWSKKKSKVLGNTGAFGRGVMRRSIKKAGKRYNAKNNSGPPRYHERGFGSLKDGIFFYADKHNDSVVIGPNKLKTQTEPLGNLASSAQLLNEGGTGRMTIVRFSRRTRGRSRIQQKPKVERVKGKWRGHSFTEPARPVIIKRFRENLERFELEP